MSANDNSFDFKGAVKKTLREQPALAQTTVFLSVQDHIGAETLILHGSPETVARHQAEKEWMLGLKLNKYLAI